MKPYDLMILGPATRDVNIDYTGAEDRSAGGAVTFCTPAARAMGASVFAAVKIAPEDRDILDVFQMPEEDKALLPSAKTTLMRNEYFTPDRERRRSGCAAQSDPILPAELPAISWKLCHLAGLLYGDFPDELLEELHRRGLLSADAQGFLRHNEGGPMALHDWQEKLRFLPWMNFFKTDAAEAEMLTGLRDREAAARQLVAWGAGEVMVSHNAEMLVGAQSLRANWPGGYYLRCVFGHADDWARYGGGAALRNSLRLPENGDSRCVSGQPCRREGIYPGILLRERKKRNGTIFLAWFFGLCSGFGLCCSAETEGAFGLRRQ